MRNYEETDFSFHLAGALSFHFRWCWGWGALYDTHAENSGKVAPGDPPPDPRLSLMRACLWKLEVGPLPEAAAAAPLATADIWSRRLCAAPDAGPGGARSPRRARTQSLFPRCGRAATHAGEAGPASPPAPAAGEIPAPHQALFRFPWRLFPAGLFVFLQITDAGKTA